MRKLKLDTFETNSPLRENFQAIEDEIKEQVIRKPMWKFTEIEIDKAYAGGSPRTTANTFYFKHNFKSIPKDILITSITGVGTPSILYNDTDEQYIYITSTNACIIRCFIGSYNEKGVD